MDLKFYHQYAIAEDQHWWFAGRRQIIDRLLRRLPLPPQAQILEAGCGTGGNLDMLSRHGQLAAMEYEAIACDLANQRGIVPVRQGRLPDQIPFDQRFDCILVLDVIEHIEDDLAALQALRAKLKPGGWLVVTVPAYAVLWSEHDEINHHQRRYRRRPLVRLIQATGLRIHYSSYFNSWLFPAVAAVRLLQRFRAPAESNRAAPPAEPQPISTDLALPAPWLNRLLYHLFASERWLMGRGGLPFGVSIVAIAQAPPSR